MSGNFTFRAHVAGLLCTATVLATVVSAAAQDLKAVPRNRTLISQGWDFYNQVPSPTNFSPYAGVLLHQRNSLHYTVNETLFYTNHNTNEIIPWQAESFSYNPDFTEITVKLRTASAGATASPSPPRTWCSRSACCGARRPTS